MLQLKWTITYHIWLVSFFFSSSLTVLQVVAVMCNSNKNIRHLECVIESIRIYTLRQSFKISWYPELVNTGLISILFPLHQIQIKFESDNENIIMTWFSYEDQQVNEHTGSRTIQKSGLDSASSIFSFLFPFYKKHHLEPSKETQSMTHRLNQCIQYWMFNTVQSNPIPPLSRKTTEERKRQRDFFSLLKLPIWWSSSQAAASSKDQRKGKLRERDGEANFLFASYSPFEKILPK